jgi:hypothetical protein
VRHPAQAVLTDTALERGARRWSGIARRRGWRGAPWTGALLACLLVALAACSSGPAGRGADQAGAGPGSGGNGVATDRVRAPRPGNGPVGDRMVVRRDAFAPSEGSGVVASRTHPGVIWAIRDGGDSQPGRPRAALYAYELAGDRLGRLPGGSRVRVVPVPGTTDVDWEDIAADDQGNLWIADIGDNGCDRASITLYKVREPSLSAASARLLATYRFRYPDPASGCRGWDAESLFLVDGVPYVISKSAFPEVYRARTLDPRHVTTLKRVGALGSGVSEPIVYPTGADIEAGHGRLAVATYATLAIYQASNPSRRGEALVADLIAHPPRWTVTLGCLICSSSELSMVEGVAFTGRDHDLTLLSERHSVWYVPTRAYER